MSLDGCDGDANATSIACFGFLTDEVHACSTSDLHKVVVGLMPWSLLAKRDHAVACLTMVKSNL